MANTIRAANDTPDLAATIAELSGLHLDDAPERDGDCVRCHCVMSTSFEDDPTLLCHDCAHRVVDQVPQLLAAARLAMELTALLGPEPVERVEQLLEFEQDLDESIRESAAEHERAEAFAAETISLRAALAEKEAILTEQQEATASVNDENARLRERVAELESLDPIGPRKP